MTFKNQVRGLKAKRSGQAFEDLFAYACRREGIIFVEIPDGCRPIPTPGGGRPRLVRVKTPFDYFITAGGRSAALDCKTIETGNFTYTMIDEDQVRSLFEVSQSIPAGYIIWFRRVDRIVFIPADTLRRIKQGQSITAQDGLYCGNAASLNPWRILGEKTVPALTQAALPGLFEGSDVEIK